MEKPPAGIARSTEEEVARRVQLSGYRADSRTVCGRDLELTARNIQQLPAILIEGERSTGCSDLSRLAGLVVQYDKRTVEGLESDRAVIWRCERAFL
ncbi:MAG: hypothetical protein ACRBK7_18445 [Acidimicrobiales bacterium]